MNELPPVGVGYPAFLAAFHLPGIRLAQPVVEVLPEIWFREISFQDWSMIENSDLAFELWYAFNQGRHAFCTVNIDDFEGTDDEAEGLRDLCLDNLRRILTAVRLHKPGAVADPSQSVLYMRVKSLNLRLPGLYRHNLFEYPIEDSCVLGAEDRDGIEMTFTRLERYRPEADETVDIALRHFDWSHRFGLTAAQRATLLCIALEATFGEYRREPRSAPSLGRRAAAASRSDDPEALASFLDNRKGGRGVRNHLAHGSEGKPPVSLDRATPLLEGAVRDGLQALLAFIDTRRERTAELEALQPGLSRMGPKQAFQIVLRLTAEGEGGAAVLLDP